VGCLRCGWWASTSPTSTAGRELLGAVVAAHPDLLRGLPFVMDRAFLDAAWMAKLKREHGIDSVIPLKANMDLLDFMRALVTHEEKPAWETVPGKPRRRLCYVDQLEDWGGEQLPLVGCYIEDERKKGGEPRCWGIITSRTPLSSARAIHEQYGDRWTIEEGFCQLRKLEEFDQLTVAHLGMITAQLLCECLAHTLAMAFLEELGQDYEEIGARRLRYDLLAQPTVVVVEIGNAYALLTPEEFHAHLEENLQAIAARQRRERARDGPAPAPRSRH
jgi:hypothetical protein